MLFTTLNRRILTLTLFGVVQASVYAGPTSVSVNSGETLTEAALLAGEFNGQFFSLEPSTTFEINDGGFIGPVAPTPGDPEKYFDFNGSTINLNSGGEFESAVFFARSNFQRAVVNVYEDGSVGSGFGTGDATTLNVLGGRLGSFGDILTGGVLNLHAGSVGEMLGVSEGATVNISGGTLDRRYGAGFGAETNISGGVIGNEVRLSSGSLTNLFVTDLFIDDVEIELLAGETFEIDTRDGAELVATLADGSLFDLTLNPATVMGEDFVADGALLTATLVPSPSALPLLGMSGTLAARRRRAAC